MADGDEPLSRSWLLPTGQAAEQESLQFIQLVRVDQVYFRGA
jgi:hypothetical protein